VSGTQPHYIIATHDITIIVLIRVIAGKHLGNGALADWLLIAPRRSAPVSHRMNFSLFITLRGDYC
jgi:hypothetical protein